MKPLRVIWLHPIHLDHNDLATTSLIPLSHRILPFKQVYNNSNLITFQTEAEEAIINKKRSKKTAKKYVARQRLSKVESGLEEQFHTGRLLGLFHLLNLG